MRSALALRTLGSRWNPGPGPPGHLNPSLPLSRSVPGSVVPIPRSSPPRPASQSRRSATGRSELPLAPRSFRSRSAGRSGRGTAARHRSHPHTPPSGCTPTVPPCGIGEGQARILRPRVRQVLLDEFAEAPPFVQLPDQNQTSVGIDSRPLKIEPQGSVERELKGLILCLTHWVSTSRRL